MLILYIAYVDLGGANSGSGIRPQRMYQAFPDAGHEVKLLCGQQARQEKDLRRAAVEETDRWLDTHMPDLCYIESPVYPILWDFDRRLIRRIHAMGIPIGYFYRDFYRRFPELFPPRKDPAGRLKEAWLGHLQKKTDRLLHCADIVYFPSREASELFSYADKRPLPPAGEDHLEEEKHPEENTCIYVGGIVNHYDGRRLLAAFEKLNEEMFCRLILVCRASEWQSLAYPTEGKAWLEVHHASGDELRPLYQRARLGLVVGVPNPYNDLAVSVKLYEYLGWGLPVVAGGSRTMERIVAENGIGLCADTTAEDLARCVREVLADPKYAERSKAFFREGNDWTARAQQVVRELSEKNK